MYNAVDRSRDVKISSRESGIAKSARTAVKKAIVKKMTTKMTLAKKSWFKQ